MSKYIPILEIFGPTIQGEGALIGQKTVFIRTGGCDYSCSWCDSSFTWNGTEKPIQMKPTEVLEAIVTLSKGQCNHVTISGGNPALIGEPMQQLVLMLRDHGFTTALETQGSKWQSWMHLIDDVTISPKAPSSGMPFTLESAQMLGMILKNLRHVNHNLKIVVFNQDDVEFAKHIFNTFQCDKKYLQVGNSSPKGEDDNLSDELLNRLEWLFNVVINEPEFNDVRALPQLHTLVWGNRRAV